MSMPAANEEYLLDQDMEEGEMDDNKLQPSGFIPPPPPPPPLPGTFPPPPPPPPPTTTATTRDTTEELVPAIQSSSGGDGVELTGAIVHSNNSRNGRGGYNDRGRGRKRGRK